LFATLVAGRHPVQALVVRPPHGRRPGPESRLVPIARGHGISILAPEDVNAPPSREALACLRPDLLVVCDYGQRLSPETLSLARLGGVNLHASLLPRYRGAAPINWALYNGETETGVSVIHMTPRIDAGPVLGQATLAIGPHDTAPQLEEQLSHLGATLTAEVIDNLARGQAKHVPQDPALATRAPRLKKSDGLVDWSRPAAALVLQVRAMEPWPKTHTWWLPPAEEPMRLILGRVEAHARPHGARPGEVIVAERSRLEVAAGSGTLAIASLQPVGGRTMSAEEFLRGHKVRPGDRMGAPP
jgi:methionyl-tRNA formyltransferase